MLAFKQNLRELRGGAHFPISNLGLARHEAAGAPRGQDRHRCRKVNDLADRADEADLDFGKAVRTIRPSSGRIVHREQYLAKFEAAAGSAAAHPPKRNGVCLAGVVVGFILAAWYDVAMATSSSEGDEEMRRGTVFGALRRFGSGVFRRRALTVLPPAIWRLFIASPA